MDRILQIGTGRFLRGFIDAFIDDDERARTMAGQPPGRRVTVVETTGSGMAGTLAAHGHAYELRTRGLDHGGTVDTSRVVHVIDRSVDASRHLDALIESALDPDLTTIISNTTEAGYARGSYPRRLASILVARARAGMPGLVILPCELVDRNGEQLQRLVTDELGDLAVDDAVFDHVIAANTWAVTQVDRIVTASGSESPGTPKPLGVVVEPFASFIIEVSERVPIIDHPSVTRTSDVMPFALRKVRILNGAHTALVWRTKGMSIRFGREAMEDSGIRDWLEGMLLEEIVPSLEERIVDGVAFVGSVLERFRNPFLDHRLSDIAVNHDQKVALRLMPTYSDHLRVFGRPPRRLEALLRQEGVLA
jgi:tagaturonate reductase